MDFVLICKESHSASKEITYIMKQHPQIPDFLIIGAGKCGTTSLDNYLKQHPDIFIPSRKEPNFYGYEIIDPEVKFADNPAEKAYYEGCVTNLDDYLRLFENAKPGQVKGETSNTYLYHDQVAERIKHYNPDMKLIAVFRQPAERLWSRYMHLARDGRLPTKSFEECLNRDSIWWRRNDLIKEGFYYTNLLSFYRMFPADQIKVILYEDFKKDNDAALRDIFKFLGVDETVPLNVEAKLNKSGYIKNEGVNKLVGNDGIVQKTAKFFLGDEGYEDLKRNPTLQKILNNIRNSNLDKPKLDPKLKSKLTHEVYGAEIDKLEGLTGLDLSRWKSTAQVAEPV